MELARIGTPEAAFVAGLVTSLHCAGMCGPLACSVIPVRRDQGDPMVAAVAYHGARLGIYTLLGVLAGGLGALPLSWVSTSALRWLPWLAVVFFIGLAFRWDRYAPRVPLLGRLYLGVSGRLRGKPAPVTAAALGLATPLLPCGPLYFLVALAFLTGSSLRGAEFMLAFGLGTVPLLWITQTQFGRLQRRVAPATLESIRKALALAAAAVVAWRLRGTLGLGGADPSSLVCF
jgi:uncharacterized protein